MYRKASMDFVTRTIDAVISGAARMATDGSNVIDVVGNGNGRTLAKIVVTWDGDRRNVFHEYHEPVDTTPVVRA